MNPLLKTFIVILLLFGVYTETGIWTTLFLFLVYVDGEIRTWRAE